MMPLILAIIFSVFIIFLINTFKKPQKSKYIDLSEVLKSQEELKILELKEKEEKEKKTFLERKKAYLVQSKTGITLGMYIGVGVISMGITFAFLYLVFKNPILALILSVIGFKIPDVFVNMKREKNLMLFNQHLIKGLRRMSSSLNAGSTLTQAMEDVCNARSMPIIIKEEFKQVLTDMSYGDKVEEALYKLYERTGSEDIKFMKLSVEVQRIVGGKMSETFDTISKTISRRFLLESEVKSTLAQSKTTGTILSVLPFLIFGGLLILNPHHFDIMRTSFLGNVIMGVLVGMMVFGTVLVRKITDIKM